MVEGSLLGDYVSEADSASAKYVLVGGFAGWIGDNITFSNADNPSWTGSFVNTGTIKFTGSTKGLVQIGGIAGRATSKLPVIVNGGKFVNKGDIVCTGSFNTAVTGSNCVGGIIGYTNQVIENAEVHCNINAQSAQFGMITGAVRSDAVIAKNCKVGGNYLENVTGEDTDGNTTTTLTEFPLDESNWMNYIYGGVTTWPAETDYDGCSFLPSKDDIVIPPVVEEPAPEPTPEA